MTYEEQQTEMKEGQQDMTRDEIIDLLKSQKHEVYDPHNIQPIQHRWIDRGLKMSCENAGHPWHESYKH